MINILVSPCKKGQILPLTANGLYGAGIHILLSRLPFPELPAGVILRAQTGEAFFQIVGRSWAHEMNGRGSSGFLCRFLQALKDIGDKKEIAFVADKPGWSAAVVTLSDKGFAGARKDEAAPAICKILKNALPMDFISYFMLPDEPVPLRALIYDLALTQIYDLIVATGGTGLSPRDITPQVIGPMLDMSIPGLAQGMLNKSLAITPHAMLSRAVTGLLGSSLLITLPGSVKGAKENLEAILPALPHALSKIHGDATDCGAAND